MVDKQVYAVFLVRGWQREFRPVEIFYDLNEAKAFIRKLEGSHLSSASFIDSASEWRIFRRTATDWEKIINFRE